MKHYFEILELQPGATPDQVKTAYRDLAKVWHPDRFRSDSPRLKSKAAEKLAEINEAYEKIRAYQARQKARKQSDNTSSSNGSAHTGYRPYTPRPSEGSGSNPNFSGYAGQPAGAPSVAARLPVQSDPSPVVTAAPILLAARIHRAEARDIPGVHRQVELPGSNRQPRHFIPSNDAGRQRSSMVLMAETTVMPIASRAVRAIRWLFILRW